MLHIFSLLPEYELEMSTKYLFMPFGINMCANKLAANIYKIQIKGKSQNFLPVSRRSCPIDLKFLTSPPCRRSKFSLLSKLVKSKSYSPRLPHYKFIAFVICQKKVSLPQNCPPSLHDKNLLLLVSGCVHYISTEVPEQKVGGILGGRKYSLMEAIFYFFNYKYFEL